MDSTNADEQTDSEIPGNVEPASKPRQHPGNLDRRIIRSHSRNRAQGEFGHIGANLVYRFIMDIPWISVIISLQLLLDLNGGGRERKGVITRMGRTGIESIHYRDPSYRPAARLMKLRDELCRRKLGALAKLVHLIVPD